MDAFDGMSNGIEDMISQNDKTMFVYEILLAGIMGSSVITVAFNTLTVVVMDKQNKVDYDICSSPTKRVNIVLAYFMAAFIAACLMSMAILTIGLIVLAVMGNCYFQFIDVLALYGITFLGAISSTALLMNIMVLFKSTSSSGAFLGILSAGLGFIIGAYIPISQFSSGIQTFANIFPGSHITSLFRQVFLKGTINHIDQALNGIDQGEFKSSIREAFIDLKMFNQPVSVVFSLIYVVALIVLSIVSVSCVYSKIYKKK